ncbi:HNH endonuclease signature motif containing protein [Phycicoccus sp. DTK01]|uniref:HNH endonuclease signature motif containing protein n=1 Tax=Phycicoccus sp. DTK01 TaxID=2785745 RepID=UPI001A8E96FF|nr:HNH endonuclease signature motif containing protein [Phycicoccus sp. DTK01]GIL34474.1 hypothetical protein PDTK01_05510 [Phycicoccus sp. DTK01]
MPTTAAPQDVIDAVRSAREALAAVGPPAASSGSTVEWAEALGALGSLVDVATARQDEVLVRLAAIEPMVLDDGELVETHRAPGHVSLDAPAVVSGVLHLSPRAAESRVRDAVRRAADGPEGSPSCTGLGGLHTAMASGALDAHRAHVVARELEEAPADVARTVVDAVAPWFEREDASRLRRRVRRVLARLSPDLLRQRAVRAREASSLRRWADEPGVDTWLGTFPSEEACTAWAAVDDLAQRYVADGTCATIDRARAKALTDLVVAHASVGVRVVMASAAVADLPADALVEVVGPGGPDPVLVEAGWLATAAYRPGARLAAFVRDRDRHCRFPGCPVSARFCDVDHVRPWPAGPTDAANLVCLCRRHHRVKQRPGWRVTLSADGELTWLDPAGRTRTTRPPDPPGLVLRRTEEEAPVPSSTAAPRLAVPDGPHSALEHRLESAALAGRPRDGCRVEVHHVTGWPPVDLSPHRRSVVRRGQDPGAAPPF